MKVLIMLLFQEREMAKKSKVNSSNFEYLPL